MLENVKELAGFASNLRIQQTSIDHPEIALKIRPMQHAVTSFCDLEFLIKALKEQPKKAADVLNNCLTNTLVQTPSSQDKLEAIKEAI